MLHMLGQGQLSRSIFPIGDLPKSETRSLAASFGLPVATKPDSQELCFAPAGDAGGFVRAHAPHLVREGGTVVDTDGHVLAEHDGVFAFTIGQRRGLGVALGEPAYVVGVEPRRNRVVVGAGALLARRALVADHVSWVGGEPPDTGAFEAEVRIRYRGEDAPAVVEPLPGDRVRVEFRVPQRAVTPGQSAVIYRAEELLGGGRIVEAIR
jgi:tRNA-specific 2-thiouridylase